MQWALAGTLAVALSGVVAVAQTATPPGSNPHPVHLVRPAAAPLSLMAQVGRDLFFDPRLSSSGKLSCASCHSPAHAFGPPDVAVIAGGPSLNRPGLRAVPSLMYLERQPPFGFDAGGPADNDVPGTPPPTAPGVAAKKTIGAQAPAALVPQGGLFWDGRSDTLQGQALGPMLNPAEMDGGSIAAIAAKLRRTEYAPEFKQLFGPAVLSDAKLLVSEAAFAIARYQVEDPHFHPYSSTYDRWLEGKAELSPAELRGLRAFNDPKGANCAACHLDAVGSDGLPPLFTDHEYEALGVPRNPAIAANHDPAFYDLGICGPVRTSMRTRHEYCAMFQTPTLRNVATRHAFFHNAAFHTLREVLAFYNFRDTAPAKVHALNDIPPRYRANVDTIDAPFGRAPGARPPMSEQEMSDIIAFLAALTDR